MPVYINNVEVTRPEGKNRTEFTIYESFYLSDILIRDQPEIAAKIAAKFGVNPSDALQAVETLKLNS